MAISMSRDEILGFASLICGVGLFSTVEISSKAIGARVDPVVLTFIRFFLTGTVLIALSIPILRLRLEPLGLRDYGIFCLNGFVGITLSITIFHTAVLVFEKAASCAVVFSANPVFVVILARYVNNEEWHLRKWVGVLTGAMGVSCFAWESGQLTIGSLHGLGLMLISAFFFALSVCITKRVIVKYGAILLMGFSALFGSLFLLPLVFVRLFCGGLGGLTETWVLVLYVSFVGTTLAYSLYYFGLLNTSAYKGSMTFFLKPVLASLMAALILHETINTYMVVGTALILSGLFMSVIGPRKPLDAAPG